MKSFDVHDILDLAVAAVLCVAGGVLAGAAAWLLCLRPVDAGRGGSMRIRRKGFEPVDLELDDVASPRWAGAG